MWNSALLRRDVKCWRNDVSVDETHVEAVCEERRGLNPVSDQSEYWITQAANYCDRLLRYRLLPSATHSQALTDRKFCFHESGNMALE